MISILSEYLPGTSLTMGPPRLREILDNGIRGAYISTPRLTLRFLRSGDEAIIHPEVDEALTEHWVGWEPGASIDDTAKMVNETLKAGVTTINLAFLAFDNETGHFVGMCGISPTDPAEDGSPEWEITIWVCHREQRKGFGLEMVASVIRWARENLALDHIIYSVATENRASMGLISHTGLQPFRRTTAKKRGREMELTEFRIPLQKPLHWAPTRPEVGSAA